MPQTQYEPVIGLEIHAQLLTKSKLFCGDNTAFGSEPNTQVSAVSLAHPGTLPVLNKEAVHLAVKLGLALGCSVNKNSIFDRKNYFYPDLPKGYQISQNSIPVCSGGHIPVIVTGVEKRIALNRIHIEEDAGKSIHDDGNEYTMIDLNRAGTPLVEIVTEPVITSAEEAFECLAMIRKIVRRLGVCDGNMEEGSLRCDANISVREKGAKTLGTKVEVKNLNSVRNVKRAISFEVERLVHILSSGESVKQETRNFDAESGATSALRTKEEANDYRYFPDPDLPPVMITDDEISSIRHGLKPLPHELEKELCRQYSISTEAASIICDDTTLMDLFSEGKAYTTEYGALSNWLIGPVKSHLNENGGFDERLAPQKIADLANLTASSAVAFAMAASRVFPQVLESDEDALTIAKRMNLIQTNDSEKLNEWVDSILKNLPEKVSEYKKGKKNLIGLFAGEVKKLSKGKADMKAAISLITEKLNK